MNLFAVSDMTSKRSKLVKSGFDTEVTSVLLLEEDALLAQTLKKLLKFQHCEVTTVQNGIAGLHKIMASSYDVIICDMMMPSMPGDMFYLAVEKVKPRLCDRFIFITGHGDNPRISAFLDKINGLVLHKPVRVADLVNTIARVIEESHPVKARTKAG